VTAELSRLAGDKVPKCLNGLTTKKARGRGGRTAREVAHSQQHREDVDHRQSGLPESAAVLNHKRVVPVNTLHWGGRRPVRCQLSMLRLGRRDSRDAPAGVVGLLSRFF